MILQQNMRHIFSQNHELSLGKGKQSCSLKVKKKTLWKQHTCKQISQKQLRRLKRSWHRTFSSTNKSLKSMHKQSLNYDATVPWGPSENRDSSRSIFQLSSETLRRLAFGGLILAPQI